MGRFKATQISKMDNPYQDLVVSDSLAENADTLNSLSPAKQRDVAAKIVMNCPKEQINSLGTQKEALRIHSNATNSQSFYQVLSQAHEVGMSAYALMDAKNKKPYMPFSDHFNADLYNQFPQLLPSLTKNNEAAVATRLALTTPDNKINPLLKNLRTIKSDFSSPLRKAFELNHNIKSKLLSNRPEQFFLKNFNVDICHQFSSLLHHHIKGKEASIGHKLANAPESKWSEIGHRLEQLTEHANDANNSFRLISETFNIQLAKNQNAKNENNSHSTLNFFAHNPQANKEPNNDNEANQKACPCWPL